jgi:hypothetical protein
VANDPAPSSRKSQPTSDAGWRTRINRPRRLELSLESLTWMIVALGVLLRVWEYLDFRQLYQDEGHLLRNLVGRAPFDFHHVLEDDQMAPPAFLVIERILVQLPLDVRASGRLFPLICAVISVFLMRGVARRYLDRRAVPIVLALFAMGDHLLYYASEIKQYSTDLVVALLALLLAAPAPDETDSRHRVHALWILGVVAPWFSFTAIFMLAGIGLHRLVTDLRRNDRRQAAMTVAMGGVWLLSFGGCFLLSKSILSSRDFIWVWWNFAFLPIPPHSRADAILLINTLANIFVHPGSLLTPFALPQTAMLASCLSLVGCYSIGRRWPGGLWIVLSPLLFGLLASALHQYPFHGRLIFYVVPTLLMTVAEGTVALGRRTAWPVTLLLAGLLIYGEGSQILWYRAVQARARSFDSHGDVKNDLLDYLEGQVLMRARLEAIRAQVHDQPRPEQPDSR